MSTQDDIRQVHQAAVRARAGTQDDIRQVLEGAQAQLERGGWRRGNFGPPDGPNCLAGAVMHTAWGLSLPYTLALEAISAVLSRRTGIDHGAISGAVHDVDELLQVPNVTWWNDKTCQSADEAIEILRLAVKEVG